MGPNQLKHSYLELYLNDICRLRSFPPHRRRTASPLDKLFRRNDTLGSNYNLYCENELKHCGLITELFNVTLDGRYTRIDI